MRPLTIIILTLTAILTGCASQLTDSQRYEIASDAYVASVEAAVDLHGAGVLDLDDLRAFDAARRPARLMLDAVHDDLAGGDDIPDDTLSRLERLITTMMEITDDRSNDGTAGPDPRD